MEEVNAGEDANGARSARLSQQAGARPKRYPQNSYVAAILVGISGFARGILLSV